MILKTLTILAYVMFFRGPFRADYLSTSHTHFASILGAHSTCNGQTPSHSIKPINGQLIKVSVVFLDSS